MPAQKRSYGHQWRFAPELRIESADPDACSAAMRGLLEYLQQAREPQAAVPAASPAPVGSDEQLPWSFAVGVSNALFRLTRAAEQLAAAGPETKEQRNLRRAVEALQDSAKEHGIDCINPTGQTYVAGREDIEIIGRAEERPGIQQPTIDLCERPIVLLNGKLLQRARATVVKPASASSSTSEGVSS